MAEQRFSVPPDPTKTAATQRTSQRAERANGQSASSLRARLRASGIARRRTEEERAEVFFPLRATTTAADPKRPGSRAAVLDERTSRHAFRLRVREEGSGSKARSSRAERAIRHCASSLKERRRSHRTRARGSALQRLRHTPAGSARRRPRIPPAIDGTPQGCAIR
jgi:hypothetical protein